MAKGRRYVDLYKAWTDREPADPGMRVWTSALHAIRLGWPLKANVLEIGCSDTHWLTFAKAYCPFITPVGVDWRPPQKGPGMRHQADILTCDLPVNTFDAIVMLSTLEHIGLGHYLSDPINADGDRVTLERCVTWLKPGGWIYADVPYDPNGYAVFGTKSRIYDEAAIAARLMPAGLEPGPRAYMNLAGLLIPKPAVGEPLASTPAHPYVYVALTWRKPPEPEGGEDHAVQGQEEEVGASA